jgi:DNA-binding transcriptional LysR family regulator
MHLDVLKYFIYVVEEKSISKAAKRAHISQSALSQMMQKLEEDIGYELLNRSNRGVTLTKTGEIVLKYGKNMIKNYEKMNQELAAYSANNNKIVIYGTGSLASYSLPCVLYKIKKKFEDYQYELDAKTVDEIISDIQNDLCDFGFIDVEVNEDLGLFSHKLGREKIVLIAKDTYKVKETINLESLLKMELIKCSMNPRIYDRLDVELNKRDLSLKDLNIIFNAGSFSAVKSSIMNGYGMAFVPYESIKHELYEKSIKIVDIEDVSLDYDIYLISKKSNQLSEAVKKSMEYLVKIGRKSFC